LKRAEERKHGRKKRENGKDPLSVNRDVERAASGRSLVCVCFASFLQNIFVSKKEKSETLYELGYDFQF